MIIIYAKNHSTNTFLVNYPSKVSKTVDLQKNKARFKVKDIWRCNHAKRYTYDTQAIDKLLLLFE